MLRTICMIVLAALAVAQIGTAAEHPVVPGFERFGGSPQRLVDTGLLLLGELNCTSCHAADPAWAGRIPTKGAPKLDQAGRRMRPEFVREFLSSPATARPGSTMPDILAMLPAAERAPAATALAHFLASTGPLNEAPAARSQVTRGDQLFHSVGCLACHSPQRPDSRQPAGSISLAHVPHKYALPGLAEFLVDPLTMRPAGRMPSLNLKPEEARDIAAYLLKDIRLLSNLRYSYYEGSWDKLPDFATLKPTQTGTTAGFDVHLGRNDQFALRFEGTVQIAKEGQYRFHLTSDDGSRLWIDGQLVVNNDEIHPAKSELGRAFLTAGRHALVVEYFEQGGEESLQIEYEGNGVKLQSLESALVVMDSPAAANEPPPFVLDATLVERGRKLFETLNCAVCHDLKGIGKPETVMAPALKQLSGNRGCLAADIQRPVPRYPLNAPQQRSLAAALSAVRDTKTADLAGSATIPATLLALNCYACHQRGDLGGVPDDRNEFFLSNQPEMGDEGRVPPHLNGIGAKLTRDWLRHVLENGTKDRPYMFTRMPKFGAANTSHLGAAFEAADPEPKYERVATGVTAGQLKSVGRRLVGSQGFSCIKCHTWGNVPGTGIQAISLTTMSRRLREAWFHDYMLEPLRYRPGTRMPAAWPMGQTLLPNLLGGNTDSQILSVWSFLTDGEHAAIPQGLGREPIELMATTEPVIYRNFIEGSGPRAIGVGYPEKVNLAFDANEFRLAMLWQGAFIDASRHWLDRGVGFQPPLGDNVLKLPGGPTVARLESADANWPTQRARQLGYQFRGYRLNDKRQPVFQYALGGIQVEDFPTPLQVGETQGIRRELKITFPTAESQCYALIASGEQIKPVDNGWYQVDDGWKVRVEAGETQPIRRRSANHTELLLPVPSTSPTTIVLTYSW